MSLLLYKKKNQHAFLVVVVVVTLNLVGEGNNKKEIKFNKFK
jgi:hypothetical protein